MINRIDPVELVRPESGDHILDIGGDTGLLRTMFDGVTFSSRTVLDVNEQTLRPGKRTGREYYVLNGSAHPLPFRSNRFDRVLITDALHHMGQNKP